MYNFYWAIKKRSKSPNAKTLNSQSIPNDSFSINIRTRTLRNFVVNVWPDTNWSLELKWSWAWDNWGALMHSFWRSCRRSSPPLREKRRKWSGRGGWVFWKLAFAYGICQPASRWGINKSSQENVILAYLLMKNLSESKSREPLSYHIISICSFKPQEPLWNLANPENTYSGKLFVILSHTFLQRKFYFIKSILTPFLSIKNEIDISSE